MTWEDSDTASTGLRAPELREVPIEDLNLTDDTFQYRLNSRPGRLLRSLASEGQKEPIDVCGTKPHRIVDGFRRVQAIRALGWLRVKALVHPDLSEDDAHAIAFIKNVVRKNLSPLERAEAIRQARRRGKSPSKIAEYLGVSEKQLSRYEALLDFPRGIRELLDRGEISMAHATVLADYGVEDPGEWAARIASERLSARRLRFELRKARGRLAPGRKRVYLRREKDRLRVYAFSMGRDAPPAERQKVVRLMKEAIAFLEGP